MTKVEKKQLPAFLVLTIISLVAAVVLAVTNEVTKGPIAAHAAAARTAAFQAVLPAAGYNELAIPEGNDSVTGLFEAVDESGASKGYTVVASASGYAGPVAVTLGVGNDGMVTGAVIGDTSFAETAGFGMRWKEETNRWEQFQQIDTANGGSIEAITGATVTSNAVLSATNAAVNCVNEVRGVEARDVVSKGAPAAPVIEQVALVGGIHEGSAKGFQSDVRVQLTMDDAGVVTGLNIDATNETPGFGTRATEEAAFAEQFVGKSAPFAIGSGIDALTGATVTSKAVVEAVNAACAAPENPDAVPFNLGGAEEEPTVETSAEPVPEGTLTASAPGFMGNNVTVLVTLNEDGTIATLDFDLSEQMAPNCDFVNTEAYKANFIGKKGPFEGIDAVTDATFTSNGIVEALNTLFAEDAALTASAPGFMGNNVTVLVTLNEDGTIATVEFDLSEQMAPNCDFVNTEEYKANFIGKKGPFEGIDAVTDATFTSNGIVEALNTLFPAEEAPVADAPAAETLTASAPGFIGNNVTVLVTLNEDGTIATLDFDLSEQMKPNCDFVNTEAYKANFIGKKGPFEGIDAVTDATFTSNGIVEALNTLFPAEEAPATDAVTEATTGATAAVEEPAADVPTQDMSVTGEEGPVAPNAATITKPGYMDKDVIVTVTFAADGTVEALVVDASTQSPGLGMKCAEEEFISQFIGKAAPFTLGDGLDAVSYATVTSQAIIDAVNEAAAQ